MGKPGADVNAGRAKLFEAVASHLDRIGRGAAEPYAEAVHRECLRTFRTERGATKTVKAASLLPMISLLRAGLPEMSRRETRQLAAELREDYERHQANTARVKANILNAIAAMHDASSRASNDSSNLRVRSLELEEGERIDAARNDGRQARAGPAWLLKMASRRGAIAEKSPGHRPGFRGGGARRIGPPWTLSSERRRRRRRRSRPETFVHRRRDAATRENGAGVSGAPGPGQRADVVQAALRLLTRHGGVLARPPGLMDDASAFFDALLACRMSVNKAVRRWRCRRQMLLDSLSGAGGRACAPPPSARRRVGAFAAGDGADRREGRPVEGAHRGARGDGSSRARGPRSGLGRRTVDTMMAASRGGRRRRRRFARRERFRQAVRGDGRALRRSGRTRISSR